MVWKVTNENKAEYVDLLVNFKFINRVDTQMKAFLDGFHDIIPKGEIDLFDPSELELLMCGLGKYNFMKWKCVEIMIIRWSWCVRLEEKYKL